MPGLLNARVCNARFSNGKKYYKDLQLGSYGDALAMDMINGGGKSFFLQCIGQTIIPNSRWQNDWNFKRVFEPKNKNTVIHCLTQWELDAGMDYKYLIAGFCASKPTRNSQDDDEKVYADFDRFSYICLFNTPNENDIFNLPLREEDENGNSKFMSLSELKRYLNSIKSTDYYTEIFTSSGNYRKRLSQYNITEAEWDLIKDVNADEKYVATHLRQYNNAEKFITEFMIPKIEDCYSTRVGYDYQDSEKLATSLLNIRDKMEELMKNKSKTQEYENIIESIQKLALKIDELSNKYTDRENLYIEIKKSIVYLEEELTLLTKNKEGLETKLVETKKDIVNLDVDIQALEIRSIEKAYMEKIGEEKEKEEELETLKGSLKKETRNAKFKTQENTYHSILQDEANISKCKSAIDTLELNNSELVSERNSLGKEIKAHLSGKKKAIEDKKKENYDNIKECELEIEKYSDSINDKKISIGGVKRDNEKLSKEKANYSKRISSNEFALIQHIDKDIYMKRRLEDELEENNVLIDESNKETMSLDKQIKEAEFNINELKYKKVKLDTEYESSDKELKIAEGLYRNCEALFDVYGCSSVEELNDTLSNKIKDTKDIKFALTNDIEKCKEIILTLNNHEIVLSDDTIHVFNILKARFNNALLGHSFIASLDIKEREYFIKMNDLIPYSILLEDNDYKKFLEDKELLDNYYGSAVPVISKKTLEEVILYPQGISFTSKGIEFYTNEEKIARLKQEKEKELENLEIRLESTTEKLSVFEKDMKIVTTFIEKYKSKSVVEDMALKVRKLEDELCENEENTEVFTKLQISLKADLLELNNKIKQLKDSVVDTRDKLKLLGLYLELKEKIENIEKEISDNQIKLSKLEKSLKVEEEYKEELKIRKDEFYDIKEAFREQEFDINKNLESLDFIGDVDNYNMLSDDDFLIKRGKLTAIIDNLQGANSDLKRLDKEIKDCEDRIKSNKSIIAVAEFELSDFAHISLDFVKNSEDILRKLNSYVKSLETQVKEAEKDLTIIKEKKGELKGNMTSKIGTLLNNNSVKYEDIKDNIDNMLNGLSYENKIKEKKKTRRETLSGKNDIEKDIRDLEGKISSNNATTNKFMSLDRDINVVVDEEKLTEIRTHQDVADALKRTEHGITFIANGIGREIDKAKNMPTSIHGYVEILTDLEQLPTSSVELKNIVSKLVGEDDESWISMLKLEQEKIEENIKSLELQEEKFVTLCIQKSENVLRDVKKITELSVIEINGRRQEMLRINLNKLPDDLAREKMKNYIEGIISSCSEEADEAARKKKIANGLRTDNLFKQIIDRIKNKSVELYKLEDLENMEVNDWLSLDKAVGSKGETNGMYIGMLICIISYLRKLYTNSTDESKKVLILDNPFAGTTSEIIWVPILNLLKENNVQLWAVGYEIKTQLANTFPTRYYMAKKASKNYENIVIDKFHSNYNVKSSGHDRLKGEKIKGTQTTMDIDI